MIADRIIFFTGLSREGGAEAVILALAKYFSARATNGGSRLVVLLAEKVPAPELLDFPPSELTLLKAARTLRSLPGIVRVLRHNQPRVIVSSLPHVSAVVSLANLLAGNKARHVVRVESSLRKRRASGSTGRLREKVTQWLLSRADHYIVVSRELIAPTATWLGRSPECFDFIPNPLVEEPVAAAEPPVIGGAGNDLRLLAVGRLAEEKNFSLAIAVVEQLREVSDRQVTLQIFGEGPLRQVLQNQIAAANLTGNVFLRGFVEDKAEIYRVGDILIVTSHFEGSPLNIIEALGHGLSVVSVDCDFGPREILTSEWLGFLAGYDPKDIAEKVLVASERFRTLDEAIRRRQYAKSHFGLASVASQHEAIFISLSECLGVMEP